MKKILATLSALALFISVNAQEKKTELWPNGNKKSEGMVLGSANVDANAPKAEQARQSAGIIKDGKWSTWNENGSVRSEEYYTKGAMTGHWKMWYEDGKLESDIDFTNGTASHYYKNGTIASQGRIKDGMISTGKWIGYYENGNKNYEGSYNANGQKDGTWTWYDENGKVIATQVYKDGTLVK